MEAEIASYVSRMVRCRTEVCVLVWLGERAAPRRDGKVAASLAAAIAMAVPALQAPVRRAHRWTFASRAGRVVDVYFVHGADAHGFPARPDVVWVTQNMAPAHAAAHFMPLLARATTPIFARNAQCLIGHDGARDEVWNLLTADAPAVPQQ